MKQLEVFGSVILAMVIIALTQLILSINNQTIVTTAIFYCLAILALLTTSLARNIFNKQSYTFLYVLGFSLLLCGAYVFIINPQYLLSVKNLNLSYWYLVSIYSLPAICTEGGMLTLYTAYVETNTLTLRESLFVKYGMVFYFLFAIGVNFFVIGNMFPVTYHILVYNINTIALVVVSIALYIKKHFLR